MESISEDEVGTLASRREDQWYERKSGRIQPRGLADAILGFANAEGGTIVVGLHDGHIDGISAVDESALRQCARDFCVPPVRHAFHLKRPPSVDGNKVAIAVIEVEASDQVHRNVRDEVYLRVGDENRRLGRVEIQELEFDKGQAAYDGRTIPADVEFAPEAVDQLAQRLHLRAPIADALSARGLTSAASGRPTVAGLLMLGQYPQGEFPEAFVRVLRYRGTSRDTGSRANVEDDIRIDGSLPSQIDRAREIIAATLPRAIRLDDTGRFTDTALIPEHAWLETVVNAVTHRSYSMGGDHIRVEIFDDRMEVESPGRLPGLVRLESIRSMRFARNPRIARALADLGYGRELGEGVDRMFEEMQRAGLPDPIYQQGPASVKVTLLSDSRLAAQLQGLASSAVQLSEVFSRFRRLTTTEAAQAIGVSRPTALKHLRALADRGVIAHQGVSMNDPRAFWQLNDR